MKCNLEKVLKEIEEYKTDELSHFYNVLKGNNSNKMDVCLGESDGNLFYLDLNEENNLFISGESARGKSSLIHSILISLLIKNNSNDLSLWLMDPKYVEFSSYKQSDNIKVAFEVDDMCNMFIEALNEIDRRKELFELNNCNNLNEYNILTGENLQNIIIVNDEILDILFMYEEEVLSYIEKLTSVKHLGIHLIISTQGLESISSNIIDCFNNRICFKSSLECSEIALGNNKAYLLNNQLIYKKDKEITLNKIYIDYNLMYKMFECIFK